jgi:PAS domain S-box-containing protein
MRRSIVVPLNAFLPSPRISSARRGALCALVFLGGFLPGLGAEDTSPPTLTNFQQVIARGRAGALEAVYPVRVRGVVAFPTHGTWELLHIYDGTNGLGVSLLNLPGRRDVISELRVGDLVEVEGETAAGSSHPFVARATIRLLGAGRFDEPRPARVSDLASGRHHGDLVRVRAVVLDMSRVRGRGVYLLNGEGHSFYASMGEAVDHLPVELLNATVEIQGMPWIQFDEAGRGTSFRLLAGSNAWVRVLKPGSSNLYAGPRHTLAAISNAPLSDDRLVVSGVVTYAWPHHVFSIQDSTGVAIVYPMQPMAKSRRDEDYVTRPPRPILRAGDRIELVASKNNVRQYAPQLRDAEYRVIGHEAMPPPPRITEAEALAGKYDAQRVRLTGRIVDRDSYEQSGAKVSRLWVKLGQQTTFASFAGSNHVEFPAPAGARVEVTGVCMVSAGPRGPARSFQLLLNSPEDVRPLPEPPVWMSATVLRIGGAAGGLVALALGWVWLLRRQVARRTAELRASEKRFSKAFQASPAFIALIRLADGVFVTVNEAFLRTSGYTESEVVGRTSRDLKLYAVPAQRDEYLRLIREVGSVRDREHLVRTKDGTLRTVLLSGEMLELDGQPHVLTVGLDITGRKQAEGETIKALAREKELGELKTSFVSMVSHEFRTPLEVIVSSADILDRYLDRLTGEERAEYLGAIQHAVKRMAGMMEDVLLLGRFESHRQQFRPDDLHLTAWCRRLADEIRSATAGRCPIELTLDESIPLARADENLLRHILTNLLSNAVKYSLPGSPVRLRLERDGCDAVFRVEDSGVGIPSADQPRLFESFHRGHNTAEIPGTGLGLVIVKRSIELHGGRIEFSSEEGKGTTFIVRLPVFNESEP